MKLRFGGSACLGGEVEGQKVKASLGYLRFCLKKINQGLER